MKVMKPRNRRDGRDEGPLVPGTKVLPSRAHEGPDMRPAVPRCGRVTWWQRGRSAWRPSAVEIAGQLPGAEALVVVDVVAPPVREPFLAGLQKPEHGAGEGDHQGAGQRDGRRTQFGDPEPEKVVERRNSRAIPKEQPEADFHHEGEDPGPQPVSQSLMAAPAHRTKRQSSRRKAMPAIRAAMMARPPSTGPTNPRERRTG